MKKILLIFFFVQILQGLFAQNDLILFRNEKEPIKCTIIEKSDDQIIYIDKSTSQIVKQKASKIKALLLNKPSQNSENYIKSLYESVLLKEKSKIIWFGLDYSIVRICCNQKNPFDKYPFKKEYFNGWNDYILTEKRFFESASTKGISNINLRIMIPNLDNIKQRNENIDFNKIFTDSTQIRIIALDTIRKIIGSFQIENMTGLGAVIIITDIRKPIEGMDFNETVSGYFSIFDIQSRSVIICEKFSEKADGIGMHWHWTKPIKSYFDVINYELNKQTWKEIYYDNPLKFLLK